MKGKDTYQEERLVS